MSAELADPITLTTRSGLAIEVRPAMPGDEAALRQLFESVSSDDRRFRFLTACDQLSNEQIAAMTQVDHWQTDSFLAFADGELVASAVLACDKPMVMAEVAISIRSDRKGQGIGWSLLDYITGEAARRGVKYLLSIESRENHQAIALEREMGFIARPVEGDSTLVLLERRF
ncbi:GNAT family N-acetyltransferase [Sphingomonas sp. HITSZ_GF]|uniref:GNAT family N-acetyltransferase n=1 Tax=Sphingomonas sp. HITSZ_GF TaxID=3037247 RepID=UPI00240E53E7|nr:GNAT family N-acetyltransferase [Sphingomonas sp. HITSZ_GF]MDG2532518.1 GNAT family N-acetyltransferase [Sphingomonas sp. HITSZ_GF]